MKHFYLLVTFLLIPFIAVFAQLNPIARWDVVPHQRIDKDKTLNVGVVAFSKARIDKVEFFISGQGYTGQNPKRATTMQHNPQTGVWEYWVPITTSEFSSDGPITIEAVVYGKDGGIRHKNTQGGGLGLDVLPLVVNPLGSLKTTEAWVDSTNGNDATGKAGDPNKPFATIGKAAKSIEDWMNSQGLGQKVDGGIVRLYPGTYRIEDGGVSSLTSTDEWLTISNYPQAGGNKNNTIIMGTSSPSTYSIPVNLLKIENITLKCPGEWMFVISNGPYQKIWVDSSNLLGSGRYTPSGNEGRVRPIAGYSDNLWYTNLYISEVDYASTADFNRNITIEKISSDAFRGGLILNSVLRDIDSDTLGYHADIWQFFGPPKKNRIMYGLYATDAHYQGLFMRHDTSQGVAQEDIALVNNIIEMRYPIKNDDGSVTNCGSYCVRTSMHNQWNHLLMWHNSFIGHAYMGGSPRDGTGEFYNASIIGNIFPNWIPSNSHDGRQETAWTLPGNTNNNEFIHNHYYTATTDSNQCWGWSGSVQNCPDTHPRSTSPDTEPGGVITQSLGKNVIDENSTSSTIGMPLPGSVVIDRISKTVFPTVPIDVFGNLRDSLADLGAFEYSTAVVSNFAASAIIACTGDTITFTDMSTNNPNTWSWNFQGGTPAISSQANPSIVYNTAGIYNVTLYASNASGGNTEIKTSYIKINPTPTINFGKDTTICNGSSVTLDPGTGFSSYLWSTGASSQTINVNSTGNYYVNVTDGSGCTGKDTIQVTIDPCAGISKPQNAASLTVYPNPANEYIVIYGKLPGWENIRLQLYNILGECIYEEQLVNTAAIEYKLNLKTLNLTDGAYLIKLISVESYVSKHFYWIQ